MRLQAAWLAPTGQMVFLDDANRIWFGCVPCGVSSGVRTRLRAGVYFDETGVVRTCAILELVTFDGEIRRLSVIDAQTGEPVPDPDDALLVETREEPC